MNVQYLTTTSNRAVVSQLSRDDASFTLAIEADMLDHPGVGGDIRTLIDAIGEAASPLVRIAPDRSPSGFDKEACALVDRLVTPAFRLAVEGQRRAAAAMEQETEELYAPRFSKGSDPVTRAEQRAWWRGLSMPNKLQTANADVGLAAAVIEGGSAMSALPTDVFERLRRSTAESQLAERILADASLRTAPSVDDPIGGMPDKATARANAASRFERLDGERELLGRVPAMLANVVTVVAMLTGETRQAAFQRLSA